MKLPLTCTPLEDFGWIAARGPDARAFLQGQLSQDVLGLAADHIALAGLHNPQGRTLAVLRLVPIATGDLLLGLPAEMLPEVLQRLRRYQLRAKLTLEDATQAWRAFGLAGENAAALLASHQLLPAGADRGALATHQGQLAWRHDTAPTRFIVLQPCLGTSDQEAPFVQGWPANDAQSTGTAGLAWHAADIAAGLPEVRTANREAFVAQMLNLDVLQAISFTKGCYTGQEVIARAHYRGRVKRRMQRFRSRTTASAMLAPGDTGRLTDGRSFRVVDAVRRADGRVEWLAVAGWPAEAPAAPTGSSENSAAPAQDASAPEMPAWDAEPLPLPYTLPTG